MPKLLGVIAFAACVVVSVSPSSATPPVAGTTPTPGLDPCLTQAAAKTVHLEAGAVKVVLNQPNVTLVLDPSKPPPTNACGAYIGDLEVASKSKPPSGYSDALKLTASWDPGSIVTDKTCTEAKNEVKIYRKSSKGGFAYAGGGRLVGTWTATSATTGTCAFTMASDFRAVGGHVPSEGETETYRAIFVNTLGSGSVHLARVPK